MHRRFLFVAVALFAGLQAADAQAHFLFMRIGPHAEAGRWVEIFFSEFATAGDPKYVKKIAHTKLWLQRTPGKFQLLEVRRRPDGLRAFLPTNGAVCVAGQCEYGVITRKLPFLLQYYPKAISAAVSGDAKQLSQMKPFEKLPLEIMATFDEDGIHLTALQNGKPAPEAEFTTIDDELSNETIKADKSGQALWKPDSPGHYCVYTSVTIKEEGRHQGQQYNEIRRFATLSFHWPLVRTDPDEEAVTLFEKALASRATWKSFPGFAAEIVGQYDGREFNGKIHVGDDGAIEVKLKEETATAWLEDQLSSIAMHRMGRSGRKKPVLYFADDKEDHPLGRLLTFVGGRFASSYRVKTNQITVVNRNIGKQNMTITVLENDKNSEGKTLPRCYNVQYWDAQSGKLLQTETIQDRWIRVGQWDLPAAHTTTTASSAGLSVRSYRLKGHRLDGK